MDFKHAPRWVRLEPDLGNNLEQRPEQRFYFEVASGLTKLQLMATMNALRDNALAATPETGGEAGAIARALEGVVRFGAEPLRVDGQPISTLVDYLTLCVAELADGGSFNVTEVIGKLREVNSFSGGRALFFARPSGGGPSTATSPNAPAGSQPDGR